MVIHRLLCVLGAVLLLSALSVIYSKYYTHLLFIDIQSQEKQLDHYEIEWGQLQLELSMLTEQNRIELMARDQLRLIVPLREKIIYINP